MSYHHRASFTLLPVCCFLPSFFFLFSCLDQTQREVIQSLVKGSKCNTNSKPIMVTIKPAAHGANALLLYGCKPATSALDLLKTACRSEFQNVKDNNVIQTSFLDLATFTGNSDDREEVYGQHNGFVDSAVQAYNQHHNLVIRPDDVWFAILAQLNIYINEHAEDLRE